MNETSRFYASVFGYDIDQRCSGCGFFKKLLVFLGILADDVDSQYFSTVDVEEDCRG